MVTSLAVLQLAIALDLATAAGPSFNETLVPPSRYHTQSAPGVLLILAPTVSIVVLVLLISSAYASTKSFWSEAEAKHLRRRWPKSDPLLEDLRRVRNTEASRRKIMRRLLQEQALHDPSLAEGSVLTAEAPLQPETLPPPLQSTAPRFLSPKMLDVLEHRVLRRWLMKEQLVLAYATLSREDLTNCFCAAFVHAPAESILGGVDLATAARRWARQLKAVNEEVSHRCSELEASMQLLVAGLFKVLSHHDSLALKEFSVGVAVAHESRGNGVVVAHLTDPARIVVRFKNGEEKKYAMHSWEKLSPQLQPARMTVGAIERDHNRSGLEHRDEDWSVKATLSNWVNLGRYEPGGRGQHDELSRLLTQPLGEKVLDDLVRERLMAVVALPELQLATRKRWTGQGASELESSLGAVLRMPLKSLGAVVLKVAALPLVAAVPPLEHCGFGLGLKRPPLAYSARLKWVLFYGSYVCFVITLSSSELPMSYSDAGAKSSLPRDLYLLLHACGDLLVELVCKVGLDGFAMYRADPWNLVVEMPAHVLSVVALTLNLLADSSGPLSSGGGTQGREVLALALVLQWARLVRILEMTEFIGPVVLMLGRMAENVIEFFVIFMVVIIAFSYGLYTLYKDPTVPPGSFDSVPLGCTNLDADFDSRHTAFVTLMDAMLAQDGWTSCYRYTSQPVTGTLLIYGYMMVGVVLLLNMLIAMMSKTFDSEHGSTRHYLFARARTFHCWRCFPPAPPPLNVLRLPYMVGQVAWYVLRLLLPSRFGEPVLPPRRNLFGSSDGLRPWEGGADDLAQQLVRYAEANRKDRAGERSTKAIERVAAAVEQQAKRQQAFERAQDTRLSAIERSLAQLQALHTQVGPSERDAASRGEALAA